MKRKKRSDIEKTYSNRAFTTKLRRLADALERGDHFTIRVAGETVRVSADAVVSIEHERAAGAGELEFQLKWSRPS
jgi:amphi-Trp domain-containing protein